jgi:hypothetical protein
MPWTSRDAKRHNKHANTPAKKKQFAAVANDVLKRTGDEGRAVRAGNAAVKKS